MKDSAVSKVVHAYQLVDLGPDEKVNRIAALLAKDRYIFPGDVQACIFKLFSTLSLMFP
jgi:hypothetical protein